MKLTRIFSVLAFTGLMSSNIYGQDADLSPISRADPCVDKLLLNISELQLNEECRVDFSLRENLDRTIYFHFLDKPIKERDKRALLNRLLPQIEHKMPPGFGDSYMRVKRVQFPSGFVGYEAEINLKVQHEGEVKHLTDFKGLSDYIADMAPYKLKYKQFLDNQFTYREQFAFGHFSEDDSTKMICLKTLEVQALAEYLTDITNWSLIPPSTELSDEVDPDDLDAYEYYVHSMRAGQGELFAQPTFNHFKVFDDMPGLLFHGTHNCLEPPSR